MIGQKISDKKYNMFKKYLSTTDINNISIANGMGKTSLQNLVYQRVKINKNNIDAYKTLCKVTLLNLISLHKESEEIINELKKEVDDYDRH